MPIKTFFKKMYFSNIILGLLLSFSSFSLLANEEAVAHDTTQAHADTAAHAAAPAAHEAESTKFDPGN